MNMQHILIQGLILYNFEVGHNAVEPTKNICCTKGENAVDHCTINRWLNKFSSGCKNLNDQKS